MNWKGAQWHCDIYRSKLQKVFGKKYDKYKPTKEKEKPTEFSQLKCLHGSENWVMRVYSRHVPGRAKQSINAVFTEQKKSINNQLALKENHYCGKCN